MNKSPQQICLAAELESLPAIRQFIEDVCQGAPQISPETIHELQLATVEASTNVISHGYAGLDPGSLILKAEILRDEIRFTLTDFGHSFEPAEPPQPDVQGELEDREQGGFGLFLIYQTMDEVDYEASTCGNRLTLVKRLPASQD